MERLTDKALACGLAARTLQGECSSGDQHLIHPFPDGMLVAVVDGLGHGLEAAEAATTAVTTLKHHAGESLHSLVEHCQARLVGTRGVAASIAAFSVSASTMTWLGVGNVEGVLVHSEATYVPEKEFLLLGRGFLGGPLPKLRAFVVPVGRGDTLTFATDGVTSDFHKEINVRERPQTIADRVLSNYGRFSDDALVLVARFLGNSQ
jgi:phosphoserine phosphatase RsbX